jgi:hypothetical protein
MQFTNVAVCTDGHVWAVSNDNKVYYRTRIVDENQQGADWAEAADNLALNGNGNGFATQVTCAGGDVMILGTDSRIFMRTGVTNDEPEGHGWAYVPGLDGQWEQITLGENGHLWMLRQNQVYRYTSELQEPSHKAITGHNIKQVNCGNWMLVTVTIFNEVYERTDYNGDAPANLDGTSWR